MTHGLTATTVPLEAALTDDPDLHLAQADMHAYFLAHDDRCECDGVCVCQEPAPA